LKGIEPALHNVTQIDITFEIDSNRRLFVYAEDKATKARESFQIKAQEARLGEEHQKK
jgi:molecular chaperone DnaK (HSP70)